MVTKPEKKVNHKKSAKDSDPEKPAKNPDSGNPSATAKLSKRKVDEDVTDGGEKVDEAVTTKKQKSKTSKADVEAAAESAEEGEEERQVKKKNKKKAGKLAGLFDKNKNDTAVTESIIPVHPALEYLSTWKKARNSWKFQKVRQTWLLLHIYDEDKVPELYFKILLAYIEDLKGSARVQTIEKANEIHRAAPPPEDAESSSDDSDNKSAKDKGAESKKHKDKKAERALEVLRVLS